MQRAQLQQRAGVIPSTRRAVVPIRPIRRRVITRVAEAETSQKATDSKPAVSYEDCIMFQAFGWDSCMKKNWYCTIEAKTQEIKAAGVTHVWLPPPSQSVSDQGYLPGQLYNLNSKYGSADDLKDLTMALNAAGLYPVADIVINHRCADQQSPDGTWNKYGDDVNHLGHKIDWGQWAITSDDPNFKGTGNPDTGDDYGPAPDLDHLNADLREALKDWLRWLHEDIGFKGWRLDFARGYGANFVPEYVRASLPEGSVCVGEYWTDLKWNGSELDGNQDAARQQIVDWIDKTQKTSAAFDFPTKGILQEAAKHTQYWRLKDSQGKAPGLIAWKPSRTVTFIDNHDTGSTQNHWPFPKDKVALGYAYILTHPGIPCIFWDHLFEWGPELKKCITDLLAVRKRNGIKAGSKLEILCAEADMYVARIDGKLTLKVGPRYDMGSLVPKKEEGWVVCASGKDFAVWEKKA